MLAKVDAVNTLADCYHIGGWEGVVGGIGLVGNGDADPAPLALSLVGIPRLESPLPASRAA